MGILIMMNNFLHDLLVAIFTCAMLAAVYFSFEMKSVQDEPRLFSLLGRMRRRFRLLMEWSFLFILISGYIRYINFIDFEWATAVSHGQTRALTIKHIILVLLIVWGLIYLRRIRRVER